MAVKMVRLGAGAKTGCKARGQQGTCLQDQTLKHSDSRELRCQLNKLVKNMETISHRTEHICPLTLKTFMTKVLFLKQEAT